MGAAAYVICRGARGGGLTGRASKDCDCEEAVIRILFVVPYLPTRVRTRPFHLIHALRAAGHAVTLATVWESAAERAVLDADSIAVPLTRARKLRNLLAALPGPTPLQAAICHQPALAAQLPALAARHDVVHVEHLRGVRYALDLRRDHPARLIVWDSVDSITHLFEQAQRRGHDWRTRLLAALDLARTRRFEAQAVAHLPLTVVTSAAEQAYLRQLSGGRGRVEVIANGVDTDYFRPDPLVAVDPNAVVFSGKLSYHANVAMCERLVNAIMPLVWVQLPHATLTLVGQSPPRAVRRLASARVRVVGSVPDIRPYVQGARVAAVPLVYGAGIQNKVLEALACGTPVVTTRQAVAATAAQPGRDLLVAETDDEFAAAIIDLLQDPVRWVNLHLRGRQLVSDNHSWTAAAEAFVSLYHSMDDEFNSSDVAAG